VVSAVEASGAPPLPVPATVVEEGQAATEAIVPQAAMEPPAEAGPSGGETVVVLDEDAIPSQ
jgi:hypothetical protein